MNSYAPNYLFRSDSMIINCHNDSFIVVNYKTSKGDLIQISKRVTTPFPKMIDSLNSP